jgi:hypothetical protein
MVWTVALVILFSAVIVFFSNEFAGGLKKFFSLPGMKLFIPLILASWLIETYEDWGYWLLIKIQAAFHQTLHYLAQMMPFERGAAAFVQIMVLFLLGGVPLWLVFLRAKQKGKRHPQLVGAYYFSLILWIVGVLLLIVAVPADLASR